MKKGIFLIPFLALMIACSGGAKQPDESVDSLQEQTEAIEESTQEVYESIQESDAEMEKTQSEIDSLLNAI
jgi:peptidoglycan hydrolase CwlO-like protein